MTRKTKEIKRRLAPIGTDDPASTFIEDLRGILWNSKQSLGMSWKEISNRAQAVTVTSPKYATICKFAGGDTLKPRFHTVFCIMAAIDIRITYSRERASNIRIMK